MELKIKERQESLPSASVYVDDLQEIVNTLANLSGFVVEISDEEAIFASLEELKKSRGNHPRAVTILGRDELGIRDVVSVSLNRPQGFGCHLRIETRGNLAAEGALVQIRALLLKRRRWFTRLVPHLNATVIEILLLAFMILLATLLFPGNSAVFGLCSILVLGHYGLWTAVGLGRLTRVSMIPSHSHEPFMKRNRDVLLVIISAVLGAVLGAFLKGLVDWWLKKHGF